MCQSLLACAEYLIHPKIVRDIGDGDVKPGHKVLDQFVLLSFRRAILEACASGNWLDFFVPAIRRRQMVVANQCSAISLRRPAAICRKLSMDGLSSGAGKSMHSIAAATSRGRHDSWRVGGHRLNTLGRQRTLVAPCRAHPFRHGAGCSDFIARSNAL